MDRFELWPINYLQPTLAEQTIITAAVESDLPEELLTQKFYVTPGVVKKGKS